MASEAASDLSRILVITYWVNQCLLELLKAPKVVPAQKGPQGQHDREVRMDTAIKKDTITVTYNGEDKVIGYAPHEKVREVLDLALTEFHVTANRHLMGLFTEGNTELPDGSTMSAAGVRPGELLVLRQSTVRGGSTQAG
jgi:hypothetical protein